MNERGVAADEFVEGVEDAAKVLELAEQALDLGSFLVEVTVGSGLSLT